MFNEDKSTTNLTGKFIATLLISAQIAWPVQSAYAGISKMPPLVQGVTPNLMFTLDDSGSMDWEQMPDNITNINYNYLVDNGNLVGAIGRSDVNALRFKTPTINTIYYDPNIRYVPWVNADGTSFTAASFTAARFNPMQTGSVINLSNTGYAVYYKYQTGQSGCSSLSPNNTACYIKVDIKTSLTYPKGPDRKDCSAASSCSGIEETKNYANWFQFWRSRMLIARGGVGLAFAEQTADLRVGWGAINETGNSTFGSNGVIKSGVRNDFDITNKTAFFDYLYSNTTPGGGTPLRMALDKVGNYFKNTSIKGPWQNTIGAANVSGKINQFTCRKNFHILMTDGYWNGAAASEATGNYDDADGPIHVYGGTANPAPTYTKYIAEFPYKDMRPQSGSLADIAMYYWSRDLRPDMANNVPLPSSTSNFPDPAYWQHLVNFTVGLGIDGTLRYPEDEAAIKAGTLKWPTAQNDNATAIDDLWHAAVNSRGKYYSAKNPIQFADSLKAALKGVRASSGSASAVGTSSVVLTNNSKIYITTYDGGNWTGKLTQKVLDSLGNLSSTGGWDTNSPGKIPAASSRKIVSTSATGVGGIDFLPAQLTSTDLSFFDDAATKYVNVTGTNIVNYIRGDSSKEATSTLPDQLRPRNDKLLGDLINSDPVYVKEGIDEGYIFLPTGATGKDSYRAFLTTKKSRAGMIYVGANDGMLHAFAESTGIEQFAFIPKAVIPNLPDLADPNYAHNFYVDGTPTIADAAIGTGTAPWKTVLVGTTGAGGKSIFALDVTDPNSFDKNKVMWEINSTMPSVDNDLGYTIGNPQIGRMKNGTWVAVFGNGYESTSGKAVLYVVNLANGQVISKVNTGVAGGNGLSTPKLIIGTDSTIIGAYAGDLKGNLWKFNFSTSSGAYSPPSLAFGSGNPLFVATAATNGSGRKQPITTQPQTYPHPKQGMIVMFGTGKIFEPNDADSVDVESIYGIWDDNAQVPRNSLVEQTISLQGSDFYKISENALDWTTKKGWNINMSVTGSAGERVIRNPLMIDDQFMLTTLIPVSDGDACVSASQSTRLTLSPLTGSPVGYATLDTNGDGLITALDNNTYSGIRGSGAFGTTVIRTGNRNIKILQVNATTGNLISGGNQQGKLSTPVPSVRLWRQIINKPM